MTPDGHSPEQPRSQEAALDVALPNLPSHDYDPRMGRPHRWYGVEHVGHPGETCVNPDSDRIGYERPATPIEQHEEVARIRSEQPGSQEAALDPLRAVPVDDVSPAPWVVERGSVAWMVREGTGGPQIGNFILEADARYVADARNRAALAATPPEDARPCPWCGHPLMCHKGPEGACPT